MDNNFSNILDIFKKLNEGTMSSAEQKPTGPSFAGGKWKGTDSADAAKNKYVGGCEESVEECGEPETLMDLLKARWEKTKQETGLQEYGMTTGGTTMQGGTNTDSPPSAGATPPDAANIQKNLQNLKSKVPDLNVQKTAQAMTKSSAGTALTTQDNAATSSLTPAVTDLMKDPQLAGQLKQLIDKGMQKDQAAQALAQKGGV